MFKWCDNVDKEKINKCRDQLLWTAQLHMDTYYVWCMCRPVHEALVGQTHECEYTRAHLHVIVDVCVCVCVQKYIQYLCVCVFWKSSQKAEQAIRPAGSACLLLAGCYRATDGTLPAVSRQPRGKHLSAPTSLCITSNYTPTHLNDSCHMLCCTKNGRYSTGTSWLKWGKVPCL